ncbi:hypothetical protein GC194_05260 [bacterium]|nr:hypothetical protein [bacterium]
MAIVSYNLQLIEEPGGGPSFYNRAMAFGDGFFESIYADAQGCSLWAYHLKRIQDGLKKLRLELPFAPESLLWAIQDLQKANGLENEKCRIKLIVYRGGSGTYLPETNAAQVFISLQKLHENMRLLKHSKGNVGFSENLVLPSFATGLKSLSAQSYVLAAMERQEKNLGELLLLNEKNEVCEAVSSNLWWFAKQKVYTPSLATGCVAGVFRAFLLEQLSRQGIACEQGCFAVDDVLAAEEVFTTNAIAGITQISQIGSKYYKSQFVHFLAEAVFS